MDQAETHRLSPAPRRPNDKPRLYKGRPGLTREAMARRAADRRARHAADALALTIASSSPHCSRRSEWPTMTWLAPASFSISAEIRPV